jgi:hypothetical protein
MSPAYAARSNDRESDYHIIIAMTQRQIVTAFNNISRAAIRPITLRSASVSPSAPIAVTVAMPPDAAECAMSLQATLCGVTV